MAEMIYLGFEPDEQEKYQAKLLARGIPASDIQLTPNEKTHIILGNPRKIAAALPLAPNLVWAHATWAGIEPLLTTTRKDYTLTNTRGVFGQLMAEYVLGYIFLFEKNILAKIEHQKQHQWDPQQPGTLRGKKIGIVGVGSIGSEVARFLKIFGAQTYGMTRSDRSSQSIVRYFSTEEYSEFCAELDYLICILPNTDATRNLVDGRFLASLPSRAILFNVGRGATLDEAALSEALRAGRLKAAVLDVFSKEPLPENDPLWDVPNLFITSHTSAPSFVDDVLQPFFENFALYKSDRPLKYQVDLERQY